jgi:hypothetical protein
MFWGLLMLMLASAEVWDIHFPRCIYSAYGSRFKLTNFVKVSQFSHIEVALNMSAFQGSCLYYVPVCVMTESNHIYCGMHDKLQEYDLFKNSWNVVKQLDLTKNFWTRDESIQAMQLFESKLFVLGDYQLIMCEIPSEAGLSWTCDPVQLFNWGNAHIVPRCNTDPQFWLVSWTPAFGIFEEAVVFDLKCLATSNLCKTFVPDDVVESYCWLTHEWVDTRQTCQ